MKIAMFFIRHKPQPQRARISRRIEIPQAWTERDWADLPVHHPRQG